MGTLAFFPWLPSPPALTCSAFSIAPFEKGVRPYPGSTDQGHVDRVLSTYHVTASAPITSATILQVPGTSLSDDLDDQAVSEAFLLSELIAVAGLSIREFFRDDYINRDNFQLVVQRFRPDRKSVAIVSRRRDGSTMSAWTDGTFKVIRPAHVPSLRSWTIDEPLLQALLAARASPIWDRVYDAIKLFNKANTDSANIDPSDEGIMLASAYQRALDCKSSSSDELARLLLARMKPTKPVRPSNCPRRSSSPGVNTRFGRASCVMEGWIEDFYALRGTIAHGKAGAMYPSVWPLHEHLLLATFLFPLVLKRELEANGLYVAQSTLQADIDTFEELTCADHFAAIDPEDDHPWTAIRSPIKLAIRRIWGELGL